MESAVESEIFPVALRYFHHAWDGAPLRLVGVRLEELESVEERPFLIRGENQLRGERLFGAVDRIRERHGRESLAVGPGTRRIKHERPKPELDPPGTGLSFMLADLEEHREEEEGAYV
jgi:hypothetical protein